MSQKSDSPKPSSEQIVKDIRRATRRQYSAEEKIRIVRDGLRGEHSIAESLYYSWSKEFVEAGDTERAATRAELSRLAGREITRDVIGSLKRHGLIDSALRAPEPGAPYAYATTKKFPEVFGLASLRDLPDIEKLEGAGPLQGSTTENELDALLRIDEDDANESREDIDPLYD